MKYKDGVITMITKVINGEQRIVLPVFELAHYMIIVDQLSMQLTGKEMVVTSLLDGKHSDKSLHCVGRAFNMRTYIYTPDELKSLVDALRQYEDVLYIVVEEDHLHIEIDRK